MTDDDLGPVLCRESSVTLTPSSRSFPLVATDFDGRAFSFGADAMLAHHLLSMQRSTRFELQLDLHGVVHSLPVPGVQLRMGDDPAARRCTLVQVVVFTTELPDVPEPPPMGPGLSGFERAMAMLTEGMDRPHLRELRREQMREATITRPYFPRNPYWSES